MPREGNQVAFQELPDGERLSRPSRADQPLLSQTAALKPLPAGDHRPQKQVAKLGRGRDDPAHVLRGKRHERGGLGCVPGGKGRLAGEHRDVRGERSRPALGEIPIALRSVVDDVDGAALDHVQRRLALAVLEHDVPTREREPGADPRKELHLLRREPRKERRMVGVEEVLDRRRRVVARHRPRRRRIGGLAGRVPDPHASRRSVHAMPPKALGSRDRKSWTPTQLGRSSILAIRVPGRSICSRYSRAPSSPR